MSSRARVEDAAKWNARAIVCDLMGHASDGVSADSLLGSILASDLTRYLARDAYTIEQVKERVRAVRAAHELGGRAAVLALLPPDARILGNTP